MIRFGSTSRISVVKVLYIADSWVEGRPSSRVNLPRARDKSQAGVQRSLHTQPNRSHRTTHYVTRIRFAWLAVSIMASTQDRAAVPGS